MRQAKMKTKEAKAAVEKLMYCRMRMLSDENLKQLNLQQRSVSSNCVVLRMILSKDPILVSRNVTKAANTSLELTRIKFKPIGRNRRIKTASSLRVSRRTTQRHHRTLTSNRSIIFAASPAAWMPPEIWFIRNADSGLILRIHSIRTKTPVASTVQSRWRHVEVIHRSEVRLIAMYNTYCTYYTEYKTNKMRNKKYFGGQKGQNNFSNSNTKLSVVVSPNNRNDKIFSRSQRRSQSHALH